MSVLAAFGRTGASFYDGTPGRQLVTCADCGRPADELFRDHGGDCLEATLVAPPKSALGIIRRYALNRPRFSMNNCRKDFDALGVPGPKRGRAFTAAAARPREWIEHDGYEPSTDPGTKRHPVAVYRSRIYKPRTAVAAARAPRDERSNP